MQKRSKGLFGGMAVSILVVLCSSLSFAQEFVHPGMLANDYDFARIRAKISANEEPWLGAWKKLEDNWHSWSTYGVRGPRDTIYRGYDGVHGENYQVMFHDASAAYANALRWKISGNEDHAKKALEILNKYATGLKYIGGTTDAMLAIGFQGYQFANAAEIMRTYPGWSAEELKAFQDMMIHVFYGLPTNPHYNAARRFLAAHNGTQDGYYWANWDISVMTTMLAIGILCDNRDIYNEAVTYFKSGGGNGNITKLVNFVYDGGLGQWQESGRDQGHTSMGPPLMAIFCEMAWKQGDDLYGMDDNRLLKGAEYVSRYNFGNAVPFTTYNHPKNFNGFETQTSVSGGGRGAIRTGWDLLYNHYVVRKGLHAPFTQIAALALRPEGGPSNGNSGDFDLIGYETLTSFLDPGFKKKNQVIQWADTTMTLGGNDFDPGVKGSSGLPCYYTLSDYSMGEIVNNKVRAYKAGTLTVTAWQTGDEEYNEAAPVSKWIVIQEPPIPGTPNIVPISDGLTIQLQVKHSSLCVDVWNASKSEGAQVVQWNCNGGENQKWTLTQVNADEYKMVSVNSGLALDVVNNADATGSLVEQKAYTGENYQIWKILTNTDGTIRIINKGNNLALGIPDSSTAGSASFAMTPYTASSAQTFTYSVIMSNQTISFAPLPDVYPGDPDVVLTAKSSSGLPITYISTNPSVATVGNGVLHVLKGGTTAIIASQPGNRNFNAAYDVTQRLVTKKKQTLAVRDLSNFKLGDPNPILGASASSELPLSITSTDTTVAQYISVDDSLVLGVMGSSLITFTQQGNETYLPFFMEKVLTIGKADPKPTRSLESFASKEHSLSTFSDGHFMMATGFESDKTVQVRVFDVLGKEYPIHKKWVDKTIHLDMQPLQSGQYFIQIHHDGKISVFKARIP